MFYSRNFFGVLLVLLATATMFPAVATVWYVTPAGAGDGATWGTAGSLQSVVNAAALYDEVWVAEGTYTKLIGSVLNMKEGARLYGGFTGVETERDQRDWEANVTILDGENTRSGVVGADNAVLDGFTIVNGKAEKGGGMFISGASSVVANCTFVNNTGGGAVYIEGDCTPTFTNCSFIENSAYENAAVYVYYPASPTISDCTFADNADGAIRCGGAWNDPYPHDIHILNSTFSGHKGSTLYSYSPYSPTVMDCEFTNNEATAISCENSGLTVGRSSFLGNKDRAIYIQSTTATILDSIFSNNRNGAVSAFSSDTSLINCVFQSNSAKTHGGAIYFSNCSNSWVTNCSFSGNTSETVGGAIAHSNSAFEVTNSILWGNWAPTNPEIAKLGTSSRNPIVTWNCIAGGYSGEGNISDDPLFVDAPYSLQLQPGSPCLDTALLVDVPETDILGRVRPDGDGVDMGAYEGSVAPEDVVSLTVEITPSGAGVTSPPGTAYYALGETAVINAYSYDMRFSHWTGDVSSTAATTTLVMDGDKAVTAVFTDNLVYRVKSGNTAPTPDGLSWATAYPDVQSAVDIAADESGEVWVAAGAYTTKLGTTVLLNMREGVTIYGGFNGSETERAQRNWATNVTVLDGQNMFLCVNTADEAGIDGFTITRGNAYDGGGLRIESGSPAIVNCTIINNTSRNGAGGGVLCVNSSPTIINCVFNENNVSVSGGAFNAMGASKPILVNCTFAANTALTTGGALYTESTNAIRIFNCIFWDNTAPASPEIAVKSGAAAPFVTYSCIEGGFSGEGNINSNPMFRNAANKDFSLRLFSPCIDSGTSAGAPDTDILGVTRPQDGGYDMGAYEYLTAVVEGEGEPIEGEGEPVEGEGEPVEGEGEPAEGEGEPVEGEGEPVEGEGEPVEGEGEPVEGEGEPAEGEGETAEGEGEPVEGEGEPVEGEGEPVEGEGEPVEGEGEPVEGEGESVEGEGEIIEGEGEPVEGEGETVEGEGETVEGEGEGEGEDEGRCGCFSGCRGDKEPAETVKRMLGDWLLIGLSLLALASFAGKRNA